jgi:hypothetical protein
MSEALVQDQVPDAPLTPEVSSGGWRVFQKPEGAVAGPWQAVDTSASIIPPEVIGLNQTGENGQRVAVVAGYTFPRVSYGGEAMTEGRVVIVKSTSPEGRPDYLVRALDDNGKVEGPTLRIPKGLAVVFGRSDASAGVHSSTEFRINPHELWPSSPGLNFGDTVSRQDVALKVDPKGDLQMQARSTNGTMGMLRLKGEELAEAPADPALDDTLPRVPSEVIVSAGSAERQPVPVANSAPVAPGAGDIVAVLSGGQDSEPAAGGAGAVLAAKHNAIMDAIGGELSATNPDDQAATAPSESGAADGGYMSPDLAELAAPPPVDTSAEKDNVLPADSDRIMTEMGASPDAVREALADQQPDPPTEETASRFTEAESFDPPLQRERALAELRDTWGVPPEGMDSEVLQRRLATTLDTLRQLSGRLGDTSDFGRDRIDVFSRMVRTVQEDQRRFDRADLEKLTDPLGRTIAQLGAMNGDNAILLDPTHRRALSMDSDLVRDLRRLHGTLSDDVMPSHMVGVFMETDAVRRTLGLMAPGGQLDQLKTAIAQAQLAIEQKQQALGWAAPEGSVVQNAAQRFANERIEGVARQLQGTGVEQAVVDAAINQMRVYVKQAVDDQSSPVSRLQRVRDDQGSQRKGGELKGNNHTSQDIVAEMAVDMLRGKFRIEDMPDPITYDSNGGVVTGQRRAAALMVLYGRNWQEAGKALGFKIEPHRPEAFG